MSKSKTLQRAQRKYQQEYQRKYRKTKEGQKARKRAQKEFHFKKVYNITLIEYNNLLKLQNNICAICKQPEIIMHKGKLIALSIDHDHTTGKVRGLLCYICNLKLKGVEDTEFRNKAIIYLGINK